MINFPEMIIKKRENMPEEWCVFSFTWLDDRAMELKGAVAPLYVRGSKKGCRNWKKMDKTTVQTFLLLSSEIEEGIERWEHETGKCHVCQGTGSKLVGWSRAEGKKYKTCDKCNGTGKAE